jgi:hypothetical protein
VHRQPLDPVARGDSLTEGGGRNPPRPPPASTEGKEMNFKELFDQIRSYVAAALAAAGLSNPQRSEVAQLLRDLVTDPASILQGQHYAIQVDVPFTAAANEEMPTSTKGLDRDALIIGATTDLNSALVKISDNSSGYSFSNQRVNVKTLAGRSDNAVPVLPWRPYLLRKGRTLSLDFKNGATGADAAGYFCFIVVYLDK